jgi:hypothetical protein
VGLPVPAVPKVDLASLRAKMEGRLSALSESDFTASGELAIALSALDIDLDDLPEASTSTDEAATIESATAFVDSFFAEYVMVEDAVPARTTREQIATAVSDDSEAPRVEVPDTDAADDVSDEVATTASEDDYDEFAL